MRVNSLIRHLTTLTICLCALLSLSCGDDPVGSGTGSWSLEPSGTAEQLNDVWGASSDDVFAVGNHGVILHYNGSSWTAMECPVAGSLRALWGRSGRDVYAVGNSGTILHYNGVAWRQMENPETPEQFNAITGWGAGDVFAGGDDGLMQRLRNGEWETISRSGGDIWGLWGGELWPHRAIRAAFVTVVAAGVGVKHFDGTSWNSLGYARTGILQDVWGPKWDNLWAVGPGGAIVHYDGFGLNRQSAPVDRILRSIWGTAHDDILAVGASGAIVHFDGNSWSRDNTGVEKNLWGVWCHRDGHAFAVGYDGTILHRRP